MSDSAAIDFDRIDLATLRRRRGEKWQLYGPDVLPAWVAEMDYPIAAPIHRVLASAIEIDDLGYPLDIQPDAIPAAFVERMESRFGWRPDPRGIEVLTDVVQGIYVAIDQYSAKGEGVVVQTPVYAPFLIAVRELERRLVEAPLVAGASRYEIDFDALRAAIDPGARVFLLCNPQNPTGRVFERHELEALAEIVLAHDLVVVSDEIHADLVYAGRKHIPFASLAPEVEARTLTLTSATKAFNIPGLRCGVAHFGSEDLRQRFVRVPRHVRGGLGSLGQAATLTAWREGQPWLDAVVAYLDGNRRSVARFVASHLPGVRSFEPEATFLAWLDCRALDLAPSPQKFFLEHARVALSDGAVFGTPGRGFARLNFATSRPLLDEILTRLEKSLRERGAR